MSDKIKEILVDTDKLSDWCVEINTRKEGKLTQEIILALKATMRDKNIEYLTAPQIGYDRRIFCIRFGDNDYRTFINPMIENNSNIMFSRETCHSIPGTEYIIPRFSKIKFFYTTPLDKVESATLAGRAAFVFQHCLDHLNGMLVSDIGLEIDELFDNATDEEREEVLQMYMESLDLRQKDLQKEIEADSDLKNLDEAIRFIEGVNNGSVVIDKTDNNKKDK